MMRVFTSPVRETTMFQDDEMVRSMYFTCTPSHATRSRLPETPQLTSPTESDAPLSPWASPDCAESEYAKRGRPRANMIKTLIDKGTFTESAIRCKTCNRVFPRDKSLQAHMRTHTGERPYVCDFPDCGKAFCQSGQLKTHQRLHTGEKPFVCSSSNCRTRFTHANRHCPDHPMSSLIRDEDNMPIPALEEVGLSPTIAAWLQRYLIQRQERTPFKMRSPLHQSATKRSLYPELESQAAKRPVSESSIESELKDHPDASENCDPDRCSIWKTPDDEPGSTPPHFEIPGLGNSPPGGNAVSVIRKVGRACLPMALFDFNSYVSPTDLERFYLVKEQHCSPVKSVHKQEEMAKTHAALALIQLAQGK